MNRAAVVWALAHATVAATPPRPGSQKLPAEEIASLQPRPEQQDNEGSRIETRQIDSAPCTTALVLWERHSWRDFRCLNPKVTP
jgi:hypothetical protein